jgi:hypothetical protein
MSGSISEDDDDAGLAVAASWTTVKSAFSRSGGKLRGSSAGKAAAGAGMTAGSVGISAAQFGTGTSSIAVAGAIAAGAAVSATGVGLVAAGAVITLATMGMSVNSMVRSTSHVVKLKKMRSSVGSYCKCNAMDGAAVTSDMANDHNHIANIVLPYIISQKTEKAVKKGVGIVPGAGLLSSVYRLGRYAFKKDRGKKRNFYAHVLTRHLITHDCALAGAIVAQLFSAEEMLTLRQFDSNESGEVIAKKMKSV